MTYLRSACCTLAAAIAVAPFGTPALGQEPDTRKPTLSIRVTPPYGFSPLRVRASAEIRGGSDDYEEFYCPTIEWEWGDGTFSESTSDCEPYEAGKSTIQRRFSADHTYRLGGRYRVVLRLKQKTRTVATASGSVQIRSGAGEGFDR